MAEAVAEKEVVAVDRKVRQIEQSRIKLAEAERAVHVVTAFDDTNHKDLLDPPYWAQVANKLTPWDHIEARGNDGSWWAEYIVLAVDRTWARVALLRHYDLSTADVSISQAMVPQDYLIKHRGPAEKWSVIRASDNAVVFDNGPQRSDAETWLRNHRAAFK